MLTIKIDTAALPMNNVYPTSKTGRRFLSPKGRDFKLLVSRATRESYLKTGFAFDPETQYISSEIFIYTPKLFTKKNKINKNKADTSNCIKTVEDAVFEALGIDDCYNLDMSVSVHQAEKPCIVFMISTHSISKKFDRPCL
jgi:Holliday junction resolvase RusA-like endonuclease